MTTIINCTCKLCTRIDKGPKADPNSVRLGSTEDRTDTSNANAAGDRAADLHDALERRVRGYAEQTGKVPNTLLLGRDHWEACLMIMKHAAKTTGVMPCGITSLIEVENHPDACEVCWLPPSDGS